MRQSDGAGGQDLLILCNVFSTDAGRFKPTIALNQTREVGYFREQSHIMSAPEGREGLSKI